PPLMRGLMPRVKMQRMSVVKAVMDREAFITRAVARRIPSLIPVSRRKFVSNATWTNADSLIFHITIRFWKGRLVAEIAMTRTKDLLSKGVEQSFLPSIRPAANVTRHKPARLFLNMRLYARGVAPVMRSTVQ